MKNIIKIFILITILSLSYNVTLASEIIGSLNGGTINSPQTPTETTGGGGSSGGGGGGGGGGGSSGSSASAVTLHGDINHDNKTNILDFVLLMANWGKTGSNVADLNNDSKIDILDFVILMANWTK